MVEGVRARATSRPVQDVSRFEIRENIALDNREEIRSKVNDHLEQLRRGDYTCSPDDREGSGRVYWEALQQDLIKSTFLLKDEAARRVLAHALKIESECSH